jgi:hypothetical protein
MTGVGQRNQRIDIQQHAWEIEQGCPHLYSYFRVGW